MRLPVGYSDPVKSCTDEDGAEYCPGVIPGAGSQFVEMWCVEGEIFFINKLTGNKFKMGRLAGPQKKVVMNNKKQDKKSKDKKDMKDMKDKKDKKDMKEKDDKDMKEQDKRDMKEKNKK